MLIVLFLQAKGEDSTSQDCDADPPEAVQGRIKELVKDGGIQALSKLAHDATPSTQEQIAIAYTQVCFVDRCPQ